jgi:hypothetical protein
MKRRCVRRVLFVLPQAAAGSVAGEYTQYAEETNAPEMKAWVIGGSASGGAANCLASLRRRCVAFILGLRREPNANFLP